MSKCKNCLITDAVPEVSVSDGICSLCRDYDPSTQAAEHQESARQEREADLEQTLQACRGQAEYDCVVPLSGGKDSVFLLYRLKHDYGLKVLAYTIDANLPDLAWDNINRTLAKLDIDHIAYRPRGGFYDKLFRYLLCNQEERGAVYSVSYVYAPLFEGDAIKLALEKDIPLVLAGYSPGQPEPERMLYEFSRQLMTSVDWTPPGLREAGQFSEEELGRFYNPTELPAGTQLPRYLAPFHAWEYDQETLIKKVVELGLVASNKHASPIHSNYPINWLLMYSDLMTFGYNPYLPEFAALIREGKASRSYWRFMAPLIDFVIRRKIGPGKEVSRSLERLGMLPEDLKINQPKGAYDPILP
jgi:hypothetical protein